MNKKVIFTFLLILNISYLVSAEMICIPKSNYTRILSNGIKQKVHLDSFLVSDTLVTVKDWNDYLSNNSNSEKQDFWNRKILNVLDSQKNWKLEIDEDWPAFYISFDEAIAYCNWKSINDGYTPAYQIKLEDGIIKTSLIPDANGYRILTKAEWQFLSDVGIDGKLLKKDGLLKNGGFVENTNGDYPIEVRSFHSNNFGIYDLVGTMNEFLWDFYNVDDCSLEIWNPKGSNEYIADEDQVYFNEPLSERRFVTNGSFCTSVYSFMDDYFYGLTSIEKGFVGFRLVRNKE